MATKHPRRAEAEAAIRVHLSTRGNGDWEAVLTQFPDVSAPSMWRWIREVKAGAPEGAQLKTAVSRIRRSLKDDKVYRTEEASQQAVRHIADQLPAAPRPEYIARTGSAGLENIDFVREIRHLYSDALMLRAYCTKVDAETGQESIKQPMLFEKQIARRASLIETSIKTVQELWDLRTMQGFYQAIIEEIGKEAPDVQHRIMDRLRALNNERGMTMFTTAF